MIAIAIAENFLIGHIQFAVQCSQLSESSVHSQSYAYVHAWHCMPACVCMHILANHNYYDLLIALL